MRDKTATLIYELVVRARLKYKTTVSQTTITSMMICLQMSHAFKIEASMMERFLNMNIDHMALNRTGSRKMTSIANGMIKQKFKCAKVSFPTMICLI